MVQILFLPIPTVITKPATATMRGMRVRPAVVGGMVVGSGVVRVVGGVVSGGVGVGVGVKVSMRRDLVAMALGTVTPVTRTRYVSG